MTMIHKEDVWAVRKDVWSVKVWNSACGCYIHEKMFYSHYLAKKWSKENPHDFQPNKIVHPAKWIVESFVLLNNAIV